MPELSRVGVEHGIFSPVSDRDVLVVGNLRGASRSALATALKRLPLVANELSDVEQAISSLELKPWAAVLVDTTLSGASRFCGEARARQALLDTPLIALTPRLTDLAFLNALRWGADDVVALGAAEPLGARLASVTTPRQDTPQRPSKGRAVVADGDARRGDALRRALHSAGYQVRDAADKASARFYASSSEVELFVLVADLTDPRTLIEEARRNGCNCRWVVLARPQHVDELEQQLSSLRGVVVMSASGPPENVLFAVNLLYPSEASRRGEVRALFGTVVLFRAVGEYRDECGFSYTASPQGLYIRTLVPAPTEKVWVELIPPDGERRVRLVGKVAWSRPFGNQADEAAPPGFGVQIVDGLGEDLALWSECLSRLDFRAPATLVPEARFSLPSYKVPIPSLAPPPLSAPGSVPRPHDATRATALGSGRVRISTRPPLRLSVPSPARLSKGAPAPTKRTLLKPQASLSSPNRRAVGRTVMGLGMLNRDGSVSQETEPVRATEATTVVEGRRHAGATPPPSAPVSSNPFEAAASSFPPSRAQSPAPDAPTTPRVSGINEAARRSEESLNSSGPSTILGTGIAPRPSSPAPDDTLEQPAAQRPDATQRPDAIAALRLSPVTGRTLVYGSSAPPPPLKPTANAMPDADTHQPDLSHRAEPPLAVQGDVKSPSHGSEDISDRPTLADHNALAIESLPPGVLESDSPDAALESDRAIRHPPPLPATRRSSAEFRAIAEEHLPGIPPHAAAQLEPPIEQPDVETRASAEAAPPQPQRSFLNDDDLTARRPIATKRKKRRGNPWATVAGAAVFALLVLLGLRLSAERGATTRQPVAQSSPPLEPTLAPTSSETPVVLRGSDRRPPPNVSPRSEAAKPTPSALAPTTPAAASRSEQTRAPSLPPQPTVDPLTLPSKSALLYVQSPHDTRVFLHGVDSGTTNTWLTVPCGTRFLRLGSAPGKWLSGGFATAIRCRAVNSVDVADE